MLLVEADAQGSMAVSLGISEPDELDVTLVNFLEKVINDEEVEAGEGIIHHEEGIDFIPANIELAVGEVSACNRAILFRSFLRGFGGVTSPGLLSIPLTGKMNGYWSHSRKHPYP